MFLDFVDIHCIDSAKCFNHPVNVLKVYKAYHDTTYAYGPSHFHLIPYILLMYNISRKSTLTKISSNTSTQTVHLLKLLNVPNQLLSIYYSFVKILCMCMIISIKKKSNISTTQIYNYENIYIFTNVNLKFKGTTIITIKERK